MILLKECDSLCCIDAKLFSSFIWNHNLWRQDFLHVDIVITNMHLYVALFSYVYKIYFNPNRITVIFTKYTNHINLESWTAYSIFNIVVLLTNSYLVLNGFYFTCKGEKYSCHFLYINIACEGLLNFYYH